MPCKEIFDKQIKSYKNKILNEARFVISIEAGSTTGWKKYVGNKGICFGLNNFGKSAPYKDIYKHYKLTSEDITRKVEKMIKKK